MTPPPIDLRRFAERVGSWLASTGPESDVVVSCRVRLARNVDGLPFVARMDPRQATDLCARLREELVAARLDGETQWVSMAEASPLLRVVLRERHLVSRDLAPSEDGQAALPGRAVAFGASETIAAMVNEEDHLRLQALASGFDLSRAWRKAQDLDRMLEARIPFAHTRMLGYLTGCPTNVGTGLRASVMMHLPALSLVRSELEKVFAAAQRTGLAVRGMYGEGSRAAGDFYQISNQITLGRSEEQLVADLQALVPAIVRFERDLRQILANERKSALQDRIQRSQGLLRTARALQTDQALAHLSTLRLGLELELITEPKLALLNQLGVQVQKGHVQALLQEEIGTTLVEASERDRLRASLLRQRLGARAN
ncbi:MAG: ATP--guanido phosphotransferase [Planctomycetota bacterium]|nr:ATP--guanido phosphotransferase [Planctomycetota bacterium]